MCSQICMCVCVWMNECWWPRDKEGDLLTGFVDHMCLVLIEGTLGQRLLLSNCYLRLHLKNTQQFLHSSFNFMLPKSKQLRRNIKINGRVIKTIFLWSVNKYRTLVSWYICLSKALNKKRERIPERLIIFTFVSVK